MKNAEEHIEGSSDGGASSRGESHVEKSPLYRRMAIVMHVVIFLYAASFWIQVGVMPVSLARADWERM